ncbi:cytochrome P450 [Auriculariales sp. MPI-PUGE-AT-0066]|nr:cytochrome P450 [Auriculariales sp. MPI-PUGE-AT-0066]
MVARVRRGFMKDDELFICDPMTLAFLLNKEPDVLDQGVILQEVTRLIHGPGLLSSTGEAHKKQRRMLGPVFTSAHIRRLLPVVFDVANELAVSLAAQCGNSGVADLDVLTRLTETSLELIGRAVLGHPLGEDGPKLNAHQKDMLPSVFEYFFWWPLLPPLRYIFGGPFLRIIVVYFCKTAAALRLRRNIDFLDKIVTSVYAEKQKGLADGSADGADDIITNLMRANLTAAPQDKQTDEEIMGHMAALVAAGRDTVGHVTARMLQGIAEHPQVQAKLREEIHKAVATADNGEPDFSSLNELPYLDAVIRETNRVWSTISFGTRVVQRDTVLPLSRPVSRSLSLAVPRGTTIRLGMQTANTIPHLWGSDVDMFRPERWLESKNGFDPLLADAQATPIPGVWSNIMSFSGGPRSCIGFRFALLEMKVLLVVLLRHFEISPAPDTERVEWWLGPSNTSFVRGREAEGPMLPVRLRLLEPPVARS